MSRSAFQIVSTYAPVLVWARRYDRAALTDDALAAVIVTIMLIPQSLAYASIAGLPPEIGLYASIAPLFAYAVFGTSSALAVGPVAVLSLMTAATIGDFIEIGSASYIEAVLALALLVGVILFLFGVFRLGFLANFLSHPIISGFISASGVLIAGGQLKHVMGVAAEGDSLVEIALDLARQSGNAHLPTLAVGGGVIVFLVWARTSLKPLLLQFGVKERGAALAARTAPLISIVASIVLVKALGLAEAGVAIVGETPKGLPTLAFPTFDWE